MKWNPPIFAIIATLCSASAVFAEPPSGTWQGPAEPIYVITKNHYAEEELGGNEGARFSDTIMIAIYTGSTGTSQSDNYYPIGTSVGLFVHGERIGSVVIKKVASLQCDSNAAIVSTPGEIQFKNGLMALATNAPNIHSHPNWTMEVGPSTIAAARSLVSEELKKHGVSDIAQDKIKVDQLIATSISTSGPKLIVGSLSFRANDAEHDLFIVGRITGSQATLEFSRYHEMKDLQDGTDIDNVRFVDQLDTDGDGVDELVLEEHGYEDEGFEILKRHNGIWTQVWSGGQGGC